MARELEGKVAAVTGGASGIGLASAEAMLAAWCARSGGRPQ
jgi:ribitol 2-dehydrogenase